MTPPSAKVFISCGQAKNTDEVTTASKISNELRELGFDTYIAVQEQTLKGLKENIFRQLATSEYFLFIDFKREKLEGSDFCRGSLFSHQEIALASFLDIEVLAFQEYGVKPTDGILHFLQANAIPFSARADLPGIVIQNVKDRKWNPQWKNELILHREPTQCTNANRVDHLGKLFPARFFHVDVVNRHRSKTANNCYAYLETIENLDTSEKIILNTVELKWAGYILPNAHVLPSQTRRFDAFWLFHESPTQMRFNVFSDATDYYPKVPDDQGHYRLTYTVVADNFPTASRAFDLKISKTLDETKLEPLS